MSNIVWYLQQINLFQNVAKEKIDLIESYFAMKSYEKREVVFEPGDSNKVFIVKTGQVELYHISPSGKKIIMERLVPGSIFGDLSAGSDDAVYVEATMDSYVCSLNRDRFFTLISQYPTESERFMKQLFARLLHVEKRMSSIASDSAFQKLVKLFLSLGKPKKQGVAELPDKFTHDELAQMLGISRQTVTTLINQLEKKEFISRRGKIIQFDPKKLEQLTL